MVKQQDKPERDVERLREDTVAMTIQVPVSIHTKMKIAAAEQHMGLYDMVIDHFDKSFNR